MVMLRPGKQEWSVTIKKQMRASRCIGLPTVYVDGPDGTIVALVGAETLAIVREPSVDGGVLCDGEKQVAFAVELDLGERTLVTRQENGPHD